MPEANQAESNPKWESMRNEIHFIFPGFEIIDSEDEAFAFLLVKREETYRVIIGITPEAINLPEDKITEYLLSLKKYRDNIVKLDKKPNMIGQGAESEVFDLGEFVVKEVNWTSLSYDEIIAGRLLNKKIRDVAPDGFFLPGTDVEFKPITYLGGVFIQANDLRNMDKKFKFKSGIRKENGGQDNSMGCYIMSSKVDKGVNLSHLLYDTDKDEETVAKLKKMGQIQDGYDVEKWAHDIFDKVGQAMRTLHIHPSILQAKNFVVDVSRDKPVIFAVDIAHLISSDTSIL